MGVTGESAAEVEAVGQGAGSGCGGCRGRGRPGYVVVRQAGELAWKILICQYLYFCTRKGCQYGKQLLRCQGIRTFVLVKRDCTFVL